MAARMGRSEEEEFKFFLTSTSTTSTPFLFFPLAGGSHMLRHAPTSGEAQRPAFLIFQMLKLLPAGLPQPPTAWTQPTNTAATNLKTQPR
ncbi:hypothetical protein FQN60_002907 [Etheostoma spectabile]|uniref:Uncharacterized protein n=1 Tax=Etheostoma spectabile TaxID=54343 RepID=A0A5J5CL71_9PERO|nr:hypothetical protein FQN60_002907 [Etheostoma spectabile]